MLVYFLAIWMGKSFCLGALVWCSERECPLVGSDVSVLVPRWGHCLGRLKRRGFVGGCVSVEVSLFPFLLFLYCVPFLWFKCEPLAFASAGCCQLSCFFSMRNFSPSGTEGQTNPSYELRQSWCFVAATKIECPWFPAALKQQPGP